MTPLPTPTPEPFDFDGGPRTVVLFHGFTGTPYELRPLGLALAEDGYRAVGPLLAGHGTSPQDLANTSAEQILQGAQHSLDQAGEIHALCGFSMGALVAGLLASDRLPNTPLVLLAPAARLRSEAELGLRAVKRGLWRVLPQFPKVVSCDCGDPQGRKFNPCYSSHPLNALNTLDNLRHRFLARLSMITSPTLIIHGKKDRVIPYKTAHAVASALGSQRVETRILQQSRHVLGLDRERDQLNQWVAEFLARQFQEP